jgi:gluconate 2-dehydrogenase gamma chain
MKRRDLLKNITLGTAGIAVAGNASAAEPKPAVNENTIAEEIPEAADGKQGVEIAHDRKLMAETFFSEHEMKTIACLADIIIPADGKSESATDAGVPDFIEFIVKDMPYHQVPMRGGLMWLDAESRRQKGKAFIDLKSAERLAIVDQIAYPDLAKPEHSQGVNFFNLMRNLTATGFFTSEIGVKDLGYVGNVPNFWDGVPQDVLDKHNLSYADWEKHLAK